MVKTTPLPRANVLDALPELANQTATAIRLHPRRGDVPGLAASKLGGVFLWPDDESWPTMPSQRPQWWADNFEFGDWSWDFPDGTPIALMSVLQINADDVPDFPFPPGKDLLQLLWYPLDMEMPPYHCAPRVFWRTSATVTRPLMTMPPSTHAHPGYILKPCTLTFERVIEYPPVQELGEEQVARLDRWLDKLGEIEFEDKGYQGKDTLYQYELSVCPGNKLGGYVCWQQDPERQTCDAGHRMEHLLTVTDMEVDGGTWPRWLPAEDRELWNDPWKQQELSNAPGWYLGGGSMYYFVCRRCDGWPIKVVYQR
jgi:hypothetical protein